MVFVTIVEFTHCKIIFYYYIIIHLLIFPYIFIQKNINIITNFMKRKVQKYPLLYCLAQQILQTELANAQEQKAFNSKTFSSKCAQDFLGYTKSIDFNRSENTKQINEEVNTEYLTQEKGKNDDYMRNIIQALSFNLTPIQAIEIFPKAMNSQVPNQGHKEKKERKLGRDFYEEKYKRLNS